MAARLIKFGMVVTSTMDLHDPRFLSVNGCEFMIIINDLYKSIFQL